MDIKKEIPKNIIKLRKACLSHAGDLIRAAKRILDEEKLPHIAYHLAVVALEEIGKSTLLIMQYLADRRGNSTWTPARFYDDHIKKLFWATWGPSMGREKITREQIESFRGLAHKIHDIRLRALYVDLDADAPLLPSKSVTKPEAQSLINAATARLKLEKLHKFGEIENDNLGNLNWFLAATSDHEKRNLIFGSKSMEKLTELGSTNKWVAWLKQEFDKAEQEARDAINQELQRKQPGDDIKMEEKWKIKIRLFSSSHSIRPRPLNKWNEMQSWIRLYPVSGKRDQLLAEFTLPKNISVHSLWFAALGAARRFVVALNIGTFGCFWWYLPEQISRFYEEIIDLENKEMKVIIERKPILKLDWKHSALADMDLENTALCFAMLPGENESELGRSMGAYIAALALLNKNDIHFQFEANSYELFYKALKHGMRHFAEWDDKEFFPDRLEKLLQSYNISREEIDKHKILARRCESTSPSFEDTKLTLSEVGFIKIMCDAYFLVKFREMAKVREVGREQ